MASAPPPTPAAGWYPDPSGAPYSRYYDGADWTDHWAPQVQSAPPVSPKPELTLMPGHERARRLDGALAHDVMKHGGRVESHTPCEACFVYGRDVSRRPTVIIAICTSVLGLVMLVAGVAFKATMIGSFPILSVLGFVVVIGGLLWSAVSFALSEKNREHRVTIRIDLYGNLIRTEE